MSFRDNDARREAAQRDFEKHFGVREEIESYFGTYSLEDVIVVEDHKRRAYYSLSVELIKVIKLTED